MCPIFGVWEFTAQYIRRKFKFKMSVSRCKIFTLFIIHNCQYFAGSTFIDNTQQTFPRLQILRHDEPFYTRQRQQNYTSHLTFSTPLTMMTIFMYSKLRTPHSHKHNATCISSVQCSVHETFTYSQLQIQYRLVSTEECAGTMRVPSRWNLTVPLKTQWPRNLNGKFRCSRNLSSS